MTDADDREAFLQARCGSFGASKVREARARTEGEAISDLLWQMGFERDK